MRTLAFVFLLVPLCGQADMMPNHRKLDEGEKASLLKYAKETCDPSVIDVAGSTYMWPEEKRLWEASGYAYLAPLKSKANLCKSRICMFQGTKPDARRKKAPTEFRWGKPEFGEYFKVWPAEGGECRGMPSSKITLMYPIEENTLRSLLDQRSALATQGLEWLRKNRPDTRLDDQVGDLERIEVSDWFGTIKYRLDYAGVRGLSVFLSTDVGKFVVEEAGPAPRP